MKIFCGVFAVFFLNLSSAAWCSQSSSGIVTFFAVDSSSISFLTSGGRTTKPSCAIDDLWILPASGSSDILSASVLTLISQGKSFMVNGTGACQNNREIVGYIVNN